MLGRAALFGRATAARIAGCARGYAGGMTAAARPRGRAPARCGGLMGHAHEAQAKMREGALGTAFRLVVWRGLVSEGVPLLLETLSEYERNMLEAIMEANCAAHKDTRTRREKVVRASRFLQEELGAGVKEAWEFLNRSPATWRFVQHTPLDRVRGTVNYFKAGGCSEDKIRQVLMSYQMLFTRRPETIEENVRHIADKVGLTQEQAFAWAVNYPVVLGKGNLSRKLEYLVESMGMSKETIKTSGPAVLKYSLEYRIKPRFELVRKMEDKHGKRFSLPLISYMGMRDNQFLEMVSKTYGDEVVQEFQELIVQEEKSNKPQITSTVVSDYEMARLDECMKRQFCAGNDTVERRERILALSQYLQKGLGAEVEEAWDLLNRGRAGKNMIMSPLETLRGTVDFFLKEGEVDKVGMLRLVSTSPGIFQVRAETISQRIDLLKECLGWGRQEIIKWVMTRPNVVAQGDLEKKIAYIMGRMELSKEEFKAGGHLLLSCSLEGRLKPRFEFVQTKEKTHGRRAKRMWPFTYPAMKFSQFLTEEFGEDAVREFDDYYEDCMKKCRGVQ